MSRIAETFAEIRRRGTPGLVAYVMAGFPDIDTTLQIVPALIEGGADIIELGFPFSDPVAEGPTIQRSSFHALQQGVTLGACIDLVARLRREGVVAPLVLMGYLNPLLSYGPARFYADAAAAGVDGLIVVDATVDEAEEIHAAAAAVGLDPIQLIAPTTTDERLERLLPGASGFIYCVSVTGVTGARGELSAALPELVARVRRRTDLPIAVGFGVSKREHVASIGQLCEAAVIGSAIVDVIDHAPPGECVTRVREYVEEVTGRRRAADLV
jgi:tryptophan synthase alpha chain